MKHLKDHRGDVYIQMLICIVLLLIISVVIFTIASSVIEKMWLDEKVDDISKLVAASGCIHSDEITEIEQLVKQQYGGEFVYTGKYIDDDPVAGLVQLNDQITVTYQSSEYVFLEVGAFKLSSPIRISRQAVSGVYYKLEDTVIDDD